tara:strand:- start:13459 stop:13617 length:159 start_codon:yes stop_codon:yes gene_type:complete
LVSLKIPKKVKPILEHYKAIAVDDFILEELRMVDPKDAKNAKNKNKDRNTNL